MRVDPKPLVKEEEEDEEEEDEEEEEEAEDEEEEEQGDEEQEAEREYEKFIRSPCRGPVQIHNSHAHFRTPVQISSA